MPRAAFEGTRLNMWHVINHGFRVGRHVYVRGAETTGIPLTRVRHIDTEIIQFVKRYAAREIPER